MILFSLSTTCTHQCILYINHFFYSYIGVSVDLFVLKYNHIQMTALVYMYVHLNV